MFKGKIELFVVWASYIGNTAKSSPGASRVDGLLRAGMSVNIVVSGVEPGSCTCRLFTGMTSTKISWYQELYNGKVVTYLED